MRKKTITIPAVTSWNEEKILNCCLRSLPRGFRGGIGSEEGEVRVTVIVERKRRTRRIERRGR
jgi:hypothetical protein